MFVTDRFFFGIFFRSADAYQFVDTNPNLVPLIQHGMPLHYRRNPIPDDSGLLQLPLLGRTTVTRHQYHTTESLATNVIDDIVVSEVASALVIDIHTHLLPPSHGPLCLWGIDELLTYVSVSFVFCREIMESVY